MTVNTMASNVPASMNGLRTRILSESHPTTIRATMSAPQNHWFRLLASAVEYGTPLGCTKVTT